MRDELLCSLYSAISEWQVKKRKRAVREFWMTLLGGLK